MEKEQREDWRGEQRLGDGRIYMQLKGAVVVILYTTNDSVGKAIKAFSIVTWIGSYSEGRWFFRG